MNSATRTTIDCTGMSCPLPILHTAKAMRELAKGDLLEVLATDPGSVPDFDAWTKSTGNELIERAVENHVYRFLIRKR